MMKACTYAYEEIEFGVGLYANGWKRIICHPIDTVKSIGSALWHPVRTVQAIYSQVKEHPVGMIINFGLSWGTGYVLGKGIDYGIDYVESLKNGSLNAGGSTSSIISQNTTSIVSASSHAEGGVSSVISQIVSQGGCGCNGVCTSVVSTTSITNQATLNEAEPLIGQNQVTINQVEPLVSQVKCGCKKVCSKSVASAITTTDQQTTLSGEEHHTNAANPMVLSGAIEYGTFDGSAGIEA